MLADFQQALADLTGSPELCLSVRRDPSILREKYELTDREWQRLTEIVRHRGMECARIVYRANRLAPLALNIPQTCKALGQELREVVSEFWAEYPETNVHFFVETDRSAGFLKQSSLKAGFLKPIFRRFWRWKAQPLPLLFRKATLRVIGSNSGAQICIDFAKPCVFPSQRNRFCSNIRGINTCQAQCGVM